MKAVVKVSRNTELYIFMSNYSPQVQNSQKLLPVLQKHQRLNCTADHVNATCGLSMKTRLRYGQTPSHLYYTAEPRGPCGRTSFISLFPRSQQLHTSCSCKRYISMLTSYTGCIQHTCRTLLCWTGSELQAFFFI